MSERCGISRGEIAPIRWEKVVPFAMQMAANLFRGDPAFDTDSVQYRLAKAFFARLDKLSKPFASKLKGAGIESISGLLLPLLHKEGLPDGDCTITF